jgi:hypothetical protein
MSGRAEVTEKATLPTTVENPYRVRDNMFF